MPSQNLLQRLEIKPQFVGFAGRIGAGKTTAARYLSSKYGLQYARYSEVLQQWLGRDDADNNRLQDLGWEVMGGGMQKELNALLIAGLDRTRGGAIDGVRHPIDFQCLSDQLSPRFHLVFLDACDEKRFERRKSRFLTRAAFERADRQPVESFIDDLRPLATISITNEGSLDDLYARLDGWVTANWIGERQ